MEEESNPTSHLTDIQFGVTSNSNQHAAENIHGRCSRGGQLLAHSLSTAYQPGKQRPRSNEQSLKVRVRRSRSKTNPFPSQNYTVSVSSSGSVNIPHEFVERWMSRLSHTTRSLWPRFNSRTAQILCGCVDYAIVTHYLSSYSSPHLFARCSSISENSCA